MYLKRKKKWSNKKSSKSKNIKNYGRSVIEILINIKLYLFFFIILSLFSSKNQEKCIENSIFSRITWKK